MLSVVEISYPHPKKWYYWGDYSPPSHASLRYFWRTRIMTMIKSHGIPDITLSHIFWIHGILIHSMPPKLNNKRLASSAPYPSLGFDQLFQYFIEYPVNTKHLYNICTMLGQCRRRWTDVVQMLYNCFVFTRYARKFIYLSSNQL